MRIVYVADHSGNDNDDEGAITHALRLLGHDVECLPIYADPTGCSGDFLLFHHWKNYTAIQTVKIPKVFWCFDLITYPDPTLATRNSKRVQWINKITELSDVGFMTDGDWVNQDTTGKLVRLLQGADIRVTANHQADLSIPLLFTGLTTTGGTERAECVLNLKKRYEKKFVTIGQKLATRVHGDRLAWYVARSEIVLAPYGPITDHYWSNRVYLMLGFGAFLLHPYAQTLTKHYTDKVDIVYYHGEEDLYSKIEYYWDRPEECNTIRQAGYRRTLAEHTYVHRCEQLIQTVQERIQ